MKTKILFLLFASIFFASCSTQFNAQKRRYQDGYNLETVKGGNKKNETIVAKEEKSTTPLAETKIAPVSNYKINDLAIDDAFSKADEVTAMIANAPQLNSINKKGQNLFAREKKIEQRKNVDYVWESNAMDPHSLSMWALGLGIASIAGCGCLAGIPGIIVGMKAKKTATDKGDQSFAQIGFVLSIIGTILSIVGGIIYALLIASYSY